MACLVSYLKIIMIIFDKPLISRLAIPVGLFLHESDFLHITLHNSVIKVAKESYVEIQTSIAINSFRKIKFKSSK